MGKSCQMCFLATVEEGCHGEAKRKEAETKRREKRTAERETCKVRNCARTCCGHEGEGMRAR